MYISHKIIKWRQSSLFAYTRHVWGAGAWNSWDVERDEAGKGDHDRAWDDTDPRIYLLGSLNCH